MTLFSIYSFGPNPPYDEPVTMCPSPRFRFATVPLNDPTVALRSGEPVRVLIELAASVIETTMANRPGLAMVVSITDAANSIKTLTGSPDLKATVESLKETVSRGPRLQRPRTARAHEAQMAQTLAPAASAL